MRMRARSAAVVDTVRERAILDSMNGARARALQIAHSRVSAVRCGRVNGFLQIKELIGHSRVLCAR